MAACRKYMKNELNTCFNKNLPHAHMESELDMLGVHGKLVKYVVHSSKRKKLKKKYFSSHKLPKQQSTNQGILGVKYVFISTSNKGLYFLIKKKNILGFKIKCWIKFANIPISSFSFIFILLTFKINLMISSLARYNLSSLVRHPFVIKIKGKNTY
jgi:hypothetical protein